MTSFVTIIKSIITTSTNKGNLNKFELKMHDKVHLNPHKAFYLRLFIGKFN